MKALSAAENGCQGLHGHARHVDQRLLGLQGDAGSLGVEAEEQALFLLGTKALAHDVSPHAAGGAELGNLL